MKSISTTSINGFHYHFDAKTEIKRRKNSMKSIGKVILSILSLAVAAALFFVIVNYSAIVASVAAAIAVGVGVFALFTKKNQYIVNKVIGAVVALLVAGLVGVLLIKVSVIAGGVIAVLAVGVGIYVSIKGSNTAE